MPILSQSLPCPHRYEEELRDTAPFDKWKAETTAEDEAERQNLIRQRREEAASAQAAAIAAKARLLKENLQTGQAIKV